LFGPPVHEGGKVRATITALVLSLATLAIALSSARFL